MGDPLELLNFFSNEKGSVILDTHFYFLEIRQATQKGQILMLNLLMSKAAEV